MQNQNSYYGLLGVDKTATPDEIKRAYRKVALSYHPDRTQDLPTEEREAAAETFRRTSEAYECLSNPRKRKIHDGSLDENGEWKPSTPSPEMEAFCEAMLRNMQKKQQKVDINTDWYDTPYSYDDVEFILGQVEKCKDISDGKIAENLCWAYKEAPETIFYTIDPVLKLIGQDSYLGTSATELFCIVAEKVKSGQARMRPESLDGMHNITVLSRLASAKNVVLARHIVDFCDNCGATRFETYIDGIRSIYRKRSDLIGETLGTVFNVFNEHYRITDDGRKSGNYAQLVRNIKERIKEGKFTLLPQHLDGIKNPEDLKQFLWLPRSPEEVEKAKGMERYMDVKGPIQANHVQSACRWRLENVMDSSRFSQILCEIFDASPDLITTTWPDVVNSLGKSFTNRSQKALYELMVDKVNKGAAVLYKEDLARVKESDVNPILLQAKFRSFPKNFVPARYNAQLG